MHKAALQFQCIVLPELVLATVLEAAQLTPGGMERRQRRARCSAGRRPRRATCVSAWALRRGAPLVRPLGLVFGLQAEFLLPLCLLAVWAF